MSPLYHEEEKSFFFLSCGKHCKFDVIRTKGLYHEEVKSFFFISCGKCCKFVLIFYIPKIVWFLKEK